MMRDKSKLYKLSNPHDIQINYDSKVPFRVMIGTYKKGRIINVETYNLKFALKEACTYCKDDELVLQVLRDGKIIWRSELI
jgi:hypothetical protein